MDVKAERAKNRPRKGPNYRANDLDFDENSKELPCKVRWTGS